MATRQEILDYVKAELERGVSPQEIRVTLTTNDWPAGEVDEALALLASHAPPKTPAIPHLVDQGEVIKHPPTAAALRGPLELIADTFHIYREKFWRIFGIAVIGELITAGIIAGVMYAFHVSGRFPFLDLPRVDTKTPLDPEQARLLFLALFEKIPEFFAAIGIVAALTGLGQICIGLSILFALADTKPGVGIGRAFLAAIARFIPYLWTLLVWASISIALIAGSVGVALCFGILSPILSPLVGVDWLFPLLGIAACITIFISFIKFSGLAMLAPLSFVVHGDSGFAALYRSGTYVRAMWWKVVGRQATFGLLLTISFFVLNFGWAYFSNTVLAQLPAGIGDVFSFAFQIVLNAFFVSLPFIFLFALYSALRAFRGELTAKPTPKQKFGYVSLSILGIALLIIMIGGFSFGIAYLQNTFQKIAPTLEFPAMMAAPFAPSAEILAQLSATPFTNDYQGYAVRYPAAWTMTVYGENKEEKTLITFSHPQNTETSKIDVAFWASAFPVSLRTRSDADVLQEMRREFKAEYEGVLIDEKMAKIGSLDAYLIRVQTNQYTQSFLFIAKGGITYTAVAQAPTPRFDELRPLFEAVFSTFTPFAPKR